MAPICGTRISAPIPAQIAPLPIIQLDTVSMPNYTHLSKIGCNYTQCIHDSQKTLELLTKSCDQLVSHQYKSGTPYQVHHFQSLNMSPILWVAHSQMTDILLLKS